MTGSSVDVELAADLAEAIVDEVSSATKDWRNVASMARELAALVAAGEQGRRLGPRELEGAAASFRGLAHPTRLQILEALRDSDDALSPKQLMEMVEPSVTLGTISHHTRVLNDVGLLVQTGTRPVRGALQHFYRLSPHGRELMVVVALSPTGGGAA